MPRVAGTRLPKTRDRGLYVRVDMSDFSKAEDGRWVAKSHALGIAVYGRTKEDATARLIDGVDFFMMTFIKYKGLTEVRAWLDRHGVEHFYGSPRDAVHKDIGAERQHRVPVGAA